MNPTVQQILRVVLRVNRDYRTDIWQLGHVIGALVRVARQAPELKPGLVAVQQRLVARYAPPWIL